MATVASNLVTPQQAALNAKKTVSPLSMAPANPANPFAMTMPQSTAPILNTAPVNFAPNAAQTASAQKAQAPMPMLKTKVTETYHPPAQPAAAQPQGYAQTDPPGSQAGTTPSGAQVNAQGGLVSLPPNSGTFNQAATGLINAGGQNLAIGQQAADIAAQYGKQITEVGRQGAAAVAGDTTTGTKLVGEGNAAVAQQSAAAQQQALAMGETAALQGTGQQLTAQGQQQSGLNAAGQLTQPQLGQQGQAYYDPETKQMSGAGQNAALNPVANIQSIAQQVARGQISPAQGYALGGSVANFQGALNQAILAINPSFNQASAQAAYDSRQQNATTAGTTPTNAAAAAYGQNYPAYLQTQAQISNVTGLGNLLLQTATGGQINPLDVSLGNQTIAQFRRNVSSTDQAKFDSTLAAFSGAASQLLSNSSGQIPTDVSANIAKIANGTLGLDALRGMVQQAQAEGQIKLQTAGSLVNTPGSTIGAPKVQGPADINALRTQYGY